MTITQAQSVLSALLGALGFEAMARSVASETDIQTLRKYARVVVKNSPESARRDISERLGFLNLA